MKLWPALNDKQILDDAEMVRRRHVFFFACDACQHGTSQKRGKV